MTEKHNRSIIKAVSWRITGTVDTILVSLLITGNIEIAAAIGGMEIFTKMFLYYLHERVWNKINFGREKTKDPEYHI